MLTLVLLTLAVSSIPCLGIKLVKQATKHETIFSASYEREPFQQILFNDSIYPSIRCEFMHDLSHMTDDLSLGGIVAAVVAVVLVICACGLGVCYAQRKGYFSSK